MFEAIFVLQSKIENIYPTWGTSFLGNKYVKAKIDERPSWSGHGGVTVKQINRWLADRAGRERSVVEYDTWELIDEY